jgi:hypothetical protein
LGEGSKRNQPCWCGSGKKYKHCHWKRSEEEPIKWWEAEKKLRSSFSQKKCSCPASWSEGCQGHIVKAHTVPVSSSLRQIARDGHVYGFKVSFQNLNLNQGKLVPELIGVNLASTFTGFCSKHDNEIFGPLEDQPFVYSHEQCFLCGYRAVSRELYTKESAANAAPLRHDADKGRSLDFQRALQSFNSMFNMGLNVGLEDNRRIKDRYDQILIDRKFGESRAYVVLLDHAPPIMCSGGWFPTVDFAGNKLQDLNDLSVPAKEMTCTSIGSNDKGFIILQWLSEADDIGLQFIDSLRGKTDYDLCLGLTRLMFEQFENIFMEPAWWEQLSSRSRNLLIDRMAEAANPFASRKSDVYFDDGLEIKAWQILKQVNVGFEFER